jgi:hypothetical protein
MVKNYITPERRKKKVSTNDAFIAAVGQVLRIVSKKRLRFSQNIVCNPSSDGGVFRRPESGTDSTLLGAFDLLFATF